MLSYIYTFKIADTLFKIHHPIFTKLLAIQITMMNMPVFFIIKCRTINNRVSAQVRYFGLLFPASLLSLGI